MVADTENWHLNISQNEMLENSMRQSVIDLCKSSVNIVVWLFFKLLHANFVRILTSSWLNSLQSPIHKFGSQFIKNFLLITSLYKSHKLEMFLRFLRLSTAYSFWDRFCNFYTNLHELFFQFISWANWVNSGKWTIAEYYVKLGLIWKKFTTISHL